MNFFNNNDPFEKIIREVFGQNPSREEYKEEIIQGEEEDRLIDFIEYRNKIYLIFELPGFDKEDILVSIKGRELEIKTKKIIKENTQNYLSQKLKKEILIRKNLPKIINSKKFSYNVKNGILEITFDKK